MKTRDGQKLTDILRFVRQIEGVRIEDGSRHQHLLKHNRAPIGNCALGGSTDFQRHLLPWLKKATGYAARELIEMYRTGTFVPKDGYDPGLAYGH